MGRPVDMTEDTYSLCDNLFPRVDARRKLMASAWFGVRSIIGKDAIWFSSRTFVDRDTSEHAVRHMASGVWLTSSSRATPISSYVSLAVMGTRLSETTSSAYTLPPATLRSGSLSSAASSVVASCASVLPISLSRTASSSVLASPSVMPPT